MAAEQVNSTENGKKTNLVVMAHEGCHATVGDGTGGFSNRPQLLYHTPTARQASGTEKGTWKH